MICDSDSDDSVDLSFAIVAGRRASNDWVSVRRPCAVDTTHSDPFAHVRSQRAVPVDPVDAEASHSDRSQDTIVHLAALVAHPDTSDAHHFANNAVAVIVVASVVFVVDSMHRTLLAAASSCPVALEIAFFAVLVADMGTCAGDRQLPQPPIAAFAIVAEPVAVFEDDRSPLRPPMDMAMLAHCSVHPNRPDRLTHLIRQHADRPCYTYCRLAIDTLDTVIAAEIAVAMDVVHDGGHMRRAVPSDVPQLQSHHIDSTHLCCRK